MTTTDNSRADALTPCIHADDPKACHRVRCQLGRKCVDDDMSPRQPAAAPIEQHKACSDERPCTACYTDTGPCQNPSLLRLVELADLQLGDGHIDRARATLHRAMDAASSRDREPITQPAAAPIDEPRNVEGMTRDEFEHRLRIGYWHDNVRAHVNAPDFRLTDEQERDIAERVEHNYPSLGTFNCPICGNAEPHEHSSAEVAQHRIGQRQSALSPADERAALPQIPDLVKATAWLTVCLRTELSRFDDNTHKALDEVEAQLSCVRAITNGAIDYEAMVAARAASANETGAEGPKRGTPEQIQLERKLTCEAIDGAMAFGYQNTNPPPSDDHWLAPYWHIGRKQAELESRSPATFPSAEGQACPADGRGSQADSGAGSADK